MSLLNETLAKIEPLNQEMMNTAKERVDFLLKPVGSLGTLEEIAVQLAGITGEMYPDVSKKAMLVLPPTMASLKKVKLPQHPRKLPV